jgi:hypothetical protein
VPVHLADETRPSPGHHFLNAVGLFRLVKDSRDRFALKRLGGAPPSPQVLCQVKVGVSNARVFLARNFSSTGIFLTPGFFLTPIQDSVFAFARIQGSASAEP